VHKIFLVQVVDSLSNRPIHFKTSFHFSMFSAAVEPVFQCTGPAELHANVQVDDVIDRSWTKGYIIGGRSRRRSRFSMFWCNNCEWWWWRWCWCWWWWCMDADAVAALADRRLIGVSLAWLRGPIVKPRVEVTHNVRMIQRSHHLNLARYSLPYFSTETVNNQKVLTEYNTPPRTCCHLANTKKT